MYRNLRYQENPITKQAKKKILKCQYGKNKATEKETKMYWMSTYNLKNEKINFKNFKTLNQLAMN